MLTLQQDAHSPEELSELDRQLVSDPGNIDLLNMVARAHYKSGSFLRAQELYVLLTEREPHRAGSWYFLGNCLFQNGSREQARRCWYTVRELDPKGRYGKLALENLVEPT